MADSLSINVSCCVLFLVKQLVPLTSYFVLLELTLKLNKTKQKRKPNTKYFHGKLFNERKNRLGVNLNKAKPMVSIFI